MPSKAFFPSFASEKESRPRVHLLANEGQMKVASTDRNFAWNKPFSKI